MFPTVHTRSLHDLVVSADCNTSLHHRGKKARYFISIVLFLFTEAQQKLFHLALIAKEGFCACLRGQKTLSYAALVVVNMHSFSYMHQKNPPYLK